MHNPTNLIIWPRSRMSGMASCWPINSWMSSLVWRQFEILVSAAWCAPPVCIHVVQERVLKPLCMDSISGRLFAGVLFVHPLQNTILASSNILMESLDLERSNMYEVLSSRVQCLNFQMILKSWCFNLNFNYKKIKSQGSSFISQSSRCGWLRELDDGNADNRGYM